ncbi:MAG: helicase-exonuclease AddAB subunit AddA [Oscillospiraceae bacterium]|jgi:ATP-dependent helicase/nuclease subunit A
MAEIHLTESQRAAVYSRGSALLVSAAAGSGKTRVLVERLMAYVTDPDDPKDIDTFLIITYTRAAAAELRGRILSDLRKRSAAQPENRRLRRQTDLCHRAQIGTIHSFCTTVLRENCHLLGLAPDFTVADEERSESLRQRTLERLLERRYETIETDAGFQALVDTVGVGRNDDRLIQVVNDLYQKLQSHPYPQDWAAEQIRAMDVSACTDIAETIWGQVLLQELYNDACYWAAVYDQLLITLYSDPELNGKIIDAYGAVLADDAEQLRAICRATEQGWEQSKVQFPFVFGKLKALRNSPNPELSDRIKACRKALKSKAENWAGYFDGTSEELLSDLAATAPAMEALLKLTLELDTVFSKEKRRRSIVDFSDLEHFAVQLLVRKEDRSPTELAKQLSHRYTEIMIDEFQDVNEVQDLLFRAVSRKETNLFMVGDIKQSIYRFRLADPQIFIHKYNTYQDNDKAEAHAPRRILLQENFRSQPAVLDSVNLVFDNIMSIELGDIAYDDQARLRCGTTVLQEPPHPTMFYLLPSPSTNDHESPGKARQEADFIAAQIQAMLSRGETVLDKDGTRPMTYGDIVILLRSPGSSGSIYHTALTAAGIPVNSDNGGGFFTSPEISILLSLLSIVDNPHQDVPLTSVLRSPIFGFTPDELSQIRTFDRHSDFYTALCLSAETMPKCQSFLQTLQGFRARAADLPVDQMIWHIYTETNLMALCSAMPDGCLRRQRLMMLFRYAGQFESNGSRGLFLFLAWINRLIERGEEPRLETDAMQNAVSILSIHKSKGLEFPVVFLADTAHRFNKSDATAPVLVHSQLGLGPCYTDLAHSVTYPTTARRAIQRCILRENLSEEMRVLYVAMTRAKERLILTASLPNPQKKWQELQKEPLSPIPPQLLFDSNSFADWLLRVAALDKDGTQIQVQFVEAGGGQLTSQAASDDSMELQAAESEEAKMLEQIQRRLDYCYPHSTAINLPSKLTVTEAEDLPVDSLDSADGQMLDTLPVRPSIFREAEFCLKKDRSLSGAEVGTAVHLVMQHIDFSKADSVAAIQMELDRLTREKILNSEQAAAVRVGQIHRFFASETGQRLRHAEAVTREFRFSLLVPAERYFPDGDGEEVLLQGVIDCFFEESGTLTILDYKTDFVNEDNVEEKIQTYTPQLRAYRDALERITGKPVSGAILYFLGTGLAIPLTFA